MKLCLPVGMNAVLLTSPSLMMELQKLAEDSGSVLFQPVGARCEVCGRRNTRNLRLTLALAGEQVRFQEQTVKGSRLPRR